MIQGGGGKLVATTPTQSAKSDRILTWTEIWQQVIHVYYVNIKIDGKPIRLYAINT